MDSSLPTATLADFLNRAKAEDDPCDTFSTGCSHLDRLLGVQRGCVVEVSGTPGSGKTTIGLSLALSALKRGHRVLWMSHLSPLPLSRLVQLGGFKDSYLRSLLHMRVQHQPQLMMLFKEQIGSLPQDVSLFVLDSLGQCFEGKQPEQDKLVKWELFRRIAQMAQQKHAAVVIFNTMKPEFVHDSHYYIPSLEFGKFDKQCQARLILYRDWSTGDDGDDDDNDGGSTLIATQYGSKNSCSFTITQQGVVDGGNNNGVAAEYPVPEIDEMLMQHKNDKYTNDDTTNKRRRGSIDDDRPSKEPHTDKESSQDVFSTPVYIPDKVEAQVQEAPEGHQQVEPPQEESSNDDHPQESGDHSVDDKQTQAAATTTTLLDNDIDNADFVPLEIPDSQSVDELT